MWAAGSCQSARLLPLCPLLCAASSFVLLYIAEKKDTVSQ